MKVLVIRFSSIGDIVLTTPIVRGLRERGAEVHYAVKKQYQGILESNPAISKVHVLETSLGPLLAALRQEHFDYVVDLHSNLRSFLLKRGLGVKSASVNKLNFRKWLLVNFKINVMPEVHIVDRYRAAAEALGIRDDGGGLDFFIPAADEVNLSVLPEPHQQGYSVYAIGGQHATKKLPPERMIELCRQLRGPLVLLGGPEDRATGEHIRSALEKEGDKGRVFNGCGSFSLNQSASLVRQAREVFSHDTGIMHIAAALKKKLTAIWGNTVPAFGMTPYRTDFVNWENNGLNCRPCSKIGYDRCPKGHFKCMKELEFRFRVDQ